MGLFNFFNKNTTTLESVIEPTEEQFIDNSEPELIKESNTIYDLNEIYNFASLDFENRGFEDAITNPDQSYKNDNLELLLLDLNTRIIRAKNYYSHRLRDVNFHIESRSQAGLVDTVNRLKTEKEKIEEDILEVGNIENEYAEKEGLHKRLSFSYGRGFNRGLASISGRLFNTSEV